MSVQGCCRDQRKMCQVIDQMKALGNNLDELQAEITALRNTYVDKEKETFYTTGLKQSEHSKTNILQKVKKYIRKVTSIQSLRKGQKDHNSQKAYYPCANLDSSLPVFLNYMFRMGMKGGLWQMPTRIKYFKCQANQTDKELQHQRFIANSPTVSMHAQSTEDILYHHRKRDNKQHTKIIFPSTQSSLSTKCSEISCDLDVQVVNPIFSPSTTEINIFPDSYIIKNCTQNVGVSLLNGKDKDSATKSTQTNVELYRQKVKNLNSQANQPNFYFSKIKNAVITKKIVRNSSKSNLTVCGNVNSTKRSQYLKREFCKRCTCRKMNDLVGSSGQETSEQNFFTDSDIPNLKKGGPMDGEKMYQTFSFEELPNSSSSSGFVHLEVNISDSSNKIEEYAERRRPRTYLIHETTQKRNEDNRKHYEKSVLYVGQTSDLTLSSSSFSNENIICN